MSQMIPDPDAIEKSLREIVDFSAGHIDKGRLESELIDLFTSGDPVANYLFEQTNAALALFSRENPELTRSKYFEAIINLVNNIRLVHSLTALFVGYEEGACFENSVFGQKHADKDFIYTEPNPAVIAGRLRDIVNHPAGHLDEEAFKGEIKELFDLKNPVSEYLEEQKDFLLAKLLEEHPEFAKPEYSVALNNLVFQIAGVYSLASSLTGFEEGAYLGSFVFGQKPSDKKRSYEILDSAAIEELLRETLDYPAGCFDGEVLLGEIKEMLTPGNPVSEYVEEQKRFLLIQFLNEYPEFSKPQYAPVIYPFTLQIASLYYLAGSLTGYEKGLLFESSEFGKQDLT